MALPAPMSLRMRLTRSLRFGFRPLRTSPVREPGEARKPRRGGKEGTVRDAIEEGLPLRFYFRDKDGFTGTRQGNPHALYWSSKGRLTLHMWVKSASASASGGLPGWRTFELARISNPRIREMGEDSFGKPRRFRRALGYHRSWYSRDGRKPVELYNPRK